MPDTTGSQSKLFGMALPDGLFGAIADDVEDDIGLEDGIGNGFKEDRQSFTVNTSAAPCD
jgi:hypothetical protein